MVKFNLKKGLVSFTSGLLATEGDLIASDKEDSRFLQKLSEAAGVSNATDLIETMVGRLGDQDLGGFKLTEL